MPPPFVITRPQDPSVQRSGAAPPPPSTLFDTVGANLTAARATVSNELNVQRLTAREEAYRGALWGRWQQIRQLTGEQFPLSASMLGGASADDPASYAAGGAALGAQPLVQNQVSDADFASRVDDLKARAGTAAAAIPTDDELRAQVGARLNAIAGRAATAAAAHPIGAFLGSAVGQALDPTNIAVGALTGGLGEGPLAARLLLGGAKQALVWGGLAAAEAPAKAAEAAKFGGPAYGLKEAESDVVSSAAGAFALHGASELLGAAGRRFLSKAVDAPADAPPAPDAAPSAADGPPGGGGLPVTPGNVVDAEFTPVEPPAALPAPESTPARLALPAPDDLRGAAQVVDKVAVADAATGPLRDGGDYDAAQAALARGEAPAMPEPTQDPTTLLTDDDPQTGPAPETPPVAPGVQVGDATTYRGRAIYSASFDPAAVEADPATFQYKAGGDAAGVTDRLRGVQTWDPTSAGRAMVYEDGAGGYTVADGHQRLGLAKRLADQDPRLDALLFRQADGWSAQDVRTMAALKNIREGSGTPLDAAKVLRDHPEALNDDSLPVTGTLAEQGRGLARLSDDAFGAVVNEVVPQHHAALIGNMAGDRPDLHAGMIDLLHRGKPANGDEARALVSEALEADWLKGEGAQADMFGAAPQSGIIARAKVKAAVLRQVRADARLFATLTRQADAIEAGGNALARSANEASLATNRAAEALITKLSYRDGAVGAAMRAAADEVDRGAKPADAARKVADEVRRAIGDADAAEVARAERLAPEPISAPAEKRTESFDEPGGRGQAEQMRPKPEDAEAEAAARARSDDLHDAARSLFDDIREPNPHADAVDALRPCAPE